MDRQFKEIKNERVQQQRFVQEMKVGQEEMKKDFAYLKTLSEEKSSATENCGHGKIF